MLRKSNWPLLPRFHLAPSIRHGYATQSECDGLNFETQTFWKCKTLEIWCFGCLSGQSFHGLTWRHLSGMHMRLKQIKCDGLKFETQTFWKCKDTWTLIIRNSNWPLLPRCHTSALYQAWTCDSNKVNVMALTLRHKPSENVKTLELW